MVFGKKDAVVLDETEPKLNDGVTVFDFEAVKLDELEGELLVTASDVDDVVTVRFNLASYFVEAKFSTFGLTVETFVELFGF